jgi:hypothetical protein
VSGFYWNGDTFMDAVEAEYDRRAGMAAEAVATAMRNRIGTDYPPASAPGSPPHRRTGDLQASVKVVHAGPLKWYVGADTRYALALELGYRPNNLDPRPFILSTLVEMGRTVYAIIVGGSDARPNIAPFARSFAPGFEP